jgi:dolichyl-phosphate-mannose-protein mannosyltransferase
VTEDSFAQHTRNERERESRRTWLTALALAVAALTIFLWGINKPQSVFYDEVIYVDSAKAFLAGGATNAEVPPLGKLLIAAGIKTFGDNALGWRVMGSFFGALTIAGVFVWVYLLVHDYALASTAAILALLNNFLYVMSRVAMMDIFLVGFLIWGLVAFTMLLEMDELSVTQRQMLLAASGAMFGFACACKWNGVDTLGVVILIATGLLWGAKRSKNEAILRHGRNLRQAGIVPSLLGLLVVPVVAYSATYWPLCHSLHRSFSLRELVTMNVSIWRLHRADLGNPGIASKWYSWIFQVGPQRALSYLVGNWVIMWGGLLALGFCIRRMFNFLPEAFVVALYGGNLLQWAITPQKYLYYYYYFPAAMFLGVAIPVALHRLPHRIFGVRLSVICVAAAGCVFLYCLPQMAHLEAPFDCALTCWP